MLLGHAVLAVAFTWPAVPRMSTQVPGFFGFENTAQTLWLFAQWKACVLEAWSAAAPGADLLSWPSRVLDAWWQICQFSMRVSMANGLDFVPTLPLEWIFGTPGYYTVKIVLILALDGLAASYLAAFLWRKPWAAFLAGALYAFNPFMVYLVTTGRVMESITVFLPLFVVDLFRTWNEPGAVAPVRAGLWLGLAACTYWFYSHFLLIFLGLFLAWHLPAGLREGVRPLGARLLKVGTILAVALLVALPAGLPYLLMLLRGERLPGGPRAFGTGPDRELLAHQLIPFSCELDYGLQWSPPWPLGTAGPPFWLATLSTFSATITLFALLGALANLRRAGFWVFALAVLYTLPLGPVLKLSGEVAGRPGLLPYAWLVQGMPLLYKLIFPNQALALWSLAAAMLACLPVARAEGAPGSGRRAALQAALLLGAVALELAARGHLPLPSSPLSPQKEVYEQVCDRATGFVYVPVNSKFWRTDEGRAGEMYVGSDLWQVDGHVALHGRKSLWSRSQMLAGTDAWLYLAPSFLENRFLAGLTDPAETGVAGLDLPEDRSALRRAGYSHVVVLERLCTTLEDATGPRKSLELGRARFEQTCATLERALGKAVAQGLDPCWDQEILRDVPVRIDYRMAIFEIPAGGAP